MRSLVVKCTAGADDAERVVVILRQPQVIGQVARSDLHIELRGQHSIYIRAAARLLILVDSEYTLLSVEAAGYIVVDRVRAAVHAQAVGAMVPVNQRA